MAKAPASPVTPVASTRKRVLTAAALLSSSRLKEVPIPEMADGDDVPVIYLRPLPAGVVMALLVDTDGKPSGDSMLLLAAQAMVDASGDLIFDPNDLVSIRQLPMDVYNRITTALSETFGVKVEAGKGSDAAPGGGLPTN